MSKAELFEIMVLPRTVFKNEIFKDMEVVKYFKFRNTDYQKDYLVIYSNCKNSKSHSTAAYQINNGQIDWFTETEICDFDLADWKKVCFANLTPYLDIEDMEEIKVRIKEVYEAHR